MITRYEHSGVQWIDVERPTIEEAESLAAEFNLGGGVVQELVTPTLKPRVDVFEEFLYLVLHFPATRDTKSKLASHEIDLIVGENFVISVHYEVVPAVLDFARSFDAIMLLKRAGSGFHSGHIIFELSHRLYQGVENELDAIEDSVSSIERAIFNGREKQMVRPISTLTRELLTHKRLMASHEEVLKQFEAGGVKLFGNQFKNFMATMSAHHFRAFNRADMLMDALGELRNTNDSLLSTRQNEIMKNLTVMTFITAPLTLFAALFGMNIQEMPIIGSEHAFWSIVAIMAAIAVVLVAYFRYKHWF